MQINNPTSIEPTPASLLDRWKQAVEDVPQRRLDDIAADIKVTEAELMAARVGSGVVRLRPSWKALLNVLTRLGPVRAWTGNQSAILETHGCYPKLQHFESCSLFVGSGIDLRLSLAFWDSAFAVVQQHPQVGETSRSLHFYGKDGRAAHKIFLTTDSSVDGFEEILEQFVHPVQDRTQTVDPRFGISKTVSPKYISQEAFLARWAEMRDTREFFPLLHEYKISRQDAFVLAEKKFTQQISPDLLYELLKSFVGRKIPLMILVGHSACVQIYRGLIRHITDLYNEITARAGKVHGCFRKKAIAAAWLVDKPTNEGPIRSLELFDWHGQPVVSIAGLSGGGFLAPAQWEKLLSRLH
jgi:putative hemin transport protein